MGSNDPTNYTDPYLRAWCPHIGIGDVLPVSSPQNIGRYHPPTTQRWGAFGALRSTIDQTQ
mgnify:CR=1 FL=1